MNTHSFIDQEMKTMTEFHKWLHEFFFGPEEKAVRDPNKVISITDYNAAILKQKKDNLSAK